MELLFGQLYLLLIVTHAIHVSTLNLSLKFASLNTLHIAMCDTVILSCKMQVILFGIHSRLHSEITIISVAR